VESRTVQLHGGPYHGKAVAVPLGQDHFHVAGYEPAESITEDEGHIHVRTRRGTYSQVSGSKNRNDFEWDGWVDHDNR
jgi:hypothetical protein